MSIISQLETWAGKDGFSPLARKAFLVRAQIRQHFLGLPVICAFKFHHHSGTRLKKKKKKGSQSRISRKAERQIKWSCTRLSFLPNGLSLRTWTSVQGFLRPWADNVREPWLRKQDVLPFPLLGLHRGVAKKQAPENNGGAAGSPRRPASRPARLSREPTWTRLPRPPPPGRRHGTAPPRPPARPQPRSPLPRAALLRGRGWGGGGRRRRREEIGGATPAAHWLLRPGARSPASVAGSRDPFQRWPPCCFDE